VYTDIFILAQEYRGKSNPIVTALLYIYCPAAAHWYLRNSPVLDVFDITWKALEDYSSGITMADCLRKYDLGTILPEVWKYIDEVEQFRHFNADVKAPETTRFFRGGKRDNIFGLQNQLNNLGGSWNSLLEYVRVWAYMMRDWHTDMKIPNDEHTDWELKKFTVRLSAPMEHGKTYVKYPVWGWEVINGSSKEIYLGLLVSGGIQDALRFALVNDSKPADGHGWPDGKRPYLFALDRVTGGAAQINLAVNQEFALNAVLPIYKAARIGPNIPLGAFQNYNQCLSCGYGKICFGDGHNANYSAVLEQLLRTDERKRFFMSQSWEEESEYDSSMDEATDQS
jgi:hypothetical protein